MKRQIQSSGKSVDEAVFNGLMEMELSIDEVDVAIVQRETHGILGIGAKPAIVTLTERDSAASSIVSSVFADKQPTTQTAPKQPTVQQPAAQPPVQERRRPPVSDTLPERHAHTEQQSRPTQPRANVVAVEEASAINYEIPAEGEVPAVDFLRELLNKMNIDATVKCAVTDEIIRIDLDSESEVLIGHHGKTLDALQYITLLAVNNKNRNAEHTRISVDIHGYRKRREEQLVKLARSKASLVKSNGRPFKFEPMNPYERRILHSALQGHNYVETHSEGEEPNRYVVIALKPGVSPRRPNNGYRGGNRSGNRNGNRSGYSQNNSQNNRG